MTNVKELKKVVQDEETGLWIVKLLSSATGKWIIVSECRTKEEAEIEKAMF